MPSKVNTKISGNDDRLKKIVSNELSELSDDTIISARSYAFAFCTNLVSVSLPNLVSGYTYLFYNCTKLKNVNLPKYDCDVLSGRYAFCYCSELAFISLPSCSRIAYTMFQNCANLVTVEMRNCTYIDKGGFYNSNNVRNFIFDNQVAFNQYSSGSLGDWLPSGFLSDGTVYTTNSNLSWYQNNVLWGSTNITFKSIQKNLIELKTIGVDITEWYEIVDELPTTDISTAKVYLIETEIVGTYEQWFYDSGSWEQLSDITI
jgi:hypothetical protein